MTVAIAVLMKDPAHGKSRLRAVLDEAERARLALALFERTLTFFRETFPDYPLAVVTPSEAVRSKAKERGAEPLSDAPGGGINAAADIAGRWAGRLGATSLLVIHADIPELRLEEIATLLELGASNAVVIAESTDGGSNALLVSPPDRIRFRFGPGSTRAHEREAERVGASFTRVLLPFLSRDLDTPADLARSAATVKRLLASPEVGA